MTESSKALQEARSNLEVLELEDELVRAKGKKGLEPSKKEHRDLKMKLRDARRKAREARDGGGE